MSATMYGSTPGAGTGQAIFTDDVSLQVFMEHLKRLVRKKKKSSFVFFFLLMSFFPCYYRPLGLKQISSSVSLD